MRVEQGWSQLDPRPVLLYLIKHDAYIVYWNGIVTTHNMALSIAGEYLGIYPTPAMQASMIQEFRQLYYSDAFNSRDWDQVVNDNSVYWVVKGALMSHLNELIPNTDPSVMLGWFDYQRAIHIKDDVYEETN